MHTALLVIDVQQGPCEGERRACEAHRVIAPINRVADKARAAGALVLFVQHEAATEFELMRFSQIVDSHSKLETPFSPRQREGAHRAERHAGLEHDRHDSSCAIRTFRDT